MPHLLEKLLEIHTIALSHDFSADRMDKDKKSYQLLPQEVLAKLTADLGADGGNFSIYRADGNYLDVRGWHCNYEPKIGENEFRERMRLIATTPMRSCSSSYRCIDGDRPILIPLSTSTDERFMTLDVATLEPKDGLSAIAAPLRYHDRPMGVIHMDILDSTRRSFDAGDLLFLQHVSGLLPPILHHNLMIEQLGLITQSCFNQPSGTQTPWFADGLCASAAEILLVPSVGIWLADEHQHTEFILRGFTGPYFTPEARGSNHDTRPYALILDPDYLQRGERVEHTQIKRRDNSPFFFPDDQDVLQALVFPLRDEQTGAAVGFVGLVDRDIIASGESYVRLAEFVARFLSLTLGALSRYEARQRISYETAAHEFRRNLRNLDNTHTRLEVAVRRLDKHAKAGICPDDLDIFNLNTICGAFRSHLLAAIETQQDLVRKKEISKTYGSKYEDITNATPILQQARIRQERIDKGECGRSVDMRAEIYDIVNGYTHAMNKKLVTGSWRVPSAPRLFKVDRQNFNLVFGNVFDNAVKYARPGSVVIVWLVVEDLRIVIHVTNIGPLIDMEGPEASDIFLPRYRGWSAKNMSDGDGIGLWQARYVANLWGGDVRLTGSSRLEGKPSAGDVIWAKNMFTIELPDNPMSSHRTYRLRA